MMWDRYDPRSDNGRERDTSRDRNRGSRGGGDSSDAREREPRDIFLRQLDLPRGPDREIVCVRDREFEINGSESRALATIGAFRVVRAEDLRACFDVAGDNRQQRDNLRHLRKSGLVEALPLESRDRAVVVLTKHGRELLDANRIERDRELRQAFYSSLRKPRELTHDAQVYRAFCRTEEQFRSRGATVQRVVLDYELKRDYQRFLQERNRGRADSDGRPDRELDEIKRWAIEHHLPFFDDSVHFPDARIEYDERNGLHRHEDIEVVTEHYRGRHAASNARAGFSQYRAVGGRGRGSGGRRRGFDPRVAEELLS